MTRLGWWGLALVVTACAVLLCWSFVDRPIAEWVHARGLFEFGRIAFRPLTHVPDPLIPLGAIAFVFTGLRAMAGCTPTRLSSFVAVCCFGVITTETVKDGLKWIFGRPWPDSWHGNEPSFIRDGDYNFHWFGGGGAYSSFPSGHMAATCAVLSVLWFYYPRLRPACLGMALAVAAGLIGSNFHFVGDVLAGAFVGAAVGTMTATLFIRDPGGGR